MEDGPSQLATGCGGLDCTFFCKNVRTFLTDVFPKLNKVLQLHGSTKHQALAITSRLDKDWKRTSQFFFIISLKLVLIELI